VGWSRRRNARPSNLRMHQPPRIDTPANGPARQDSKAAILVLRTAYQRRQPLISNLLISPDAVPILLPDVLALVPPGAHQVAAYVDVRQARIARDKMPPADVEQPCWMPMAASHLAEALTHLEIARSGNGFLLQLRHRLSATWTRKAVARAVGKGVEGSVLRRVRARQSGKTKPGRTACKIEVGATVVARR
jgi:hypothetical protein